VELKISVRGKDDVESLVMKIASSERPIWQGWKMAAGGGVFSL